MSKRKLTYKDFKNYFSNNLQNKDKQDFEKRMMQDAFEEEAFDGLSQLTESELEKDIAELKSGIIHRTKKTYLSGRQSRRLVPAWFKYAASVVILVGIGLSILLLNNRFWQDSLLNEQISQEMEKADSIILEAEKEIQKSDEKSIIDTSEKATKNLIAESRKPEKKKQAKPVEKEIIIEDKQPVSEAFVTETDVEIEEIDPVLEIVEFDEAEEELAEIAEVTVDFDTKAKESEEMAKVAESPTKNIMIRGTTSIPKSAKKTRTEQVLASDGYKTKTIKGKVLGEEDELSIPGVSIVLKDNPTIGTTTNIDGEFSLTIPDNEELKSLIASFVGMESIEISIENDTNLLVYMEADVLEMDEVVVTGVGISRESGDYSAAEPVKINAKPPDGISFKKYKEQILENLDYSKLADFPGKHKIKISIDLTASGRISYIEVNNSPDEIFDIEIENVIEALGRWIPATNNEYNEASTVKFTLKIVVE